jgi:SepF-like predicted cell division protein (DUF552 family)
MRSGTIGKTLIALGIAISVYAYYMSVYSDGYLSFPSISERQNLLIVAGTLFIGGIILFAVDNLKQTKDENVIESSRQLAAKEPEIFKMVATRKGVATVITLFLGIFGLMYIASSYTRRAPNVSITAVGKSDKGAEKIGRGDEAAANEPPARDSPPIISRDYVKAFEAAANEPPARDLPPVVSRVYAKAFIFDIFRKSMADGKPEFRDEVIQEELISCVAPNINAAINKIYPARVNELDRATFEDRLDITLFKDVFSDEVTKECITAVKQQVEQKKQSSGRFNPTPVTHMDLDDLRLDLASLTDRKVRVMAVGSYMMNSFLLKKSMTDMNMVIVDISNLQREERRQIIQQCSDIMSGCRVTVSGTVRKGSLQNKLSAERIELQ